MDLWVDASGAAIRNWVRVSPGRNLRSGPAMAEAAQLTGMSRDVSTGSRFGKVSSSTPPS